MHFPAEKMRFSGGTRQETAGNCRRASRLKLQESKTLANSHKKNVPIPNRILAFARQFSRPLTPPSQPAKWWISSGTSMKRTSNRIANTQPKLRTNPPKIVKKRLLQKCKGNFSDQSSGWILQGIFWCIFLGLFPWEKLDEKIHPKIHSKIQIRTGSFTLQGSGLGKIANKQNCEQTGVSEKWTILVHLGPPKRPFCTKNAIAMEIVVFCYCGSVLLFVPTRCHFSPGKKQHPNPVKSKRGREQGDGTEFVSNCRKVSYDALWRFMTLYDVLCQVRKATEIVIKCRKVSQDVVNCRKVSQNVVKCRITLVPFPPSPFGFHRSELLSRQWIATTVANDHRHSDLLPVVFLLGTPRPVFTPMCV